MFPDIPMMGVLTDYQIEGMCTTIHESGAVKK